MFSDWLQRNRLLLVLLLATSLVLPLAVHRLVGLAADDAFIHRRIALNYVQTGHAYFNPGQRVMVTSSPLWTILLTVGTVILRGSDPAPWLETLFMLASSTAAFLLLAEGVESECKFTSLFPAVAFLYTFIGNFPSAIDQMETPCAIAFLLAGTLGVARRKSWGVPLLVVACFVRLECCLLLLLAVVWTSARRQWTKSSLIASAVIGLSAVAWLLSQFHTVIPNSALAKGHAYAIPYRLVAHSFFLSNAAAGLCLVLASLWWFYGRNRSRGLSPSASLLAGFGVLLGLAYISHRVFVFDWYLPLVLVSLSIGILCGTSRQGLWKQAIGIAFAGALLAPFVATDGPELRSAVEGSPAPIAAYGPEARVHEYQRIGTALYRVCPTANLMSSEIGALGWTFHGPILDGLGLASPEAVRYHPIPVPGGVANPNFFGITSGIPGGYVQDFHPDLIVSYDIFAQPAMPVAASLHYATFSFPLFVREDRPYAVSLWGAAHMLVFVSPTSPCSPTAVHDSVSMALEQ